MRNGAKRGRRRLSVALMPIEKVVEDRADVPIKGTVSVHCRLLDGRFSIPGRRDPRDQSKISNRKSAI
jgi:hypothetical protein